MTSEGLCDFSFSLRFELFGQNWTKAASGGGYAQGGEGGEERQIIERAERIPLLARKSLPLDVGGPL